MVKQTMEVVGYNHHTDRIVVYYYCLLNSVILDYITYEVKWPVHCAKYGLHTGDLYKYSKYAIW